MASRLITLAMAANNVAERSILCSDGIRLSAKHWTSTSSPNQRRVLCLHGWLDNAESFHLLAPSLVQRGCASDVVALDFPGHGLSSHKSPDGPPQLLAEYAFYVAETVEQLEWDTFNLIGHSMGSGVSVIFAAAFPEKVKSLVLLEGAGPLARNSRDFSKHVRKACEKRLTANKTLYSDDHPEPHQKSARVYPTLEKAVETRMYTAKMSPGMQYLSREAASAMVDRATIPAPTGGDTVIFRHDPRLQWPSLQYNTREQVEGLLEDIQCPTCLLQAENGWPIDQRTQQNIKKLLKLSAHQKLKGSHHFHADPETANAVIDRIEEFFSSIS